MSLFALFTSVTFNSSVTVFRLQARLCTTQWTKSSLLCKTVADFILSVFGIYGGELFLGLTSAGSRAVGGKRRTRGGSTHDQPTAREFSWTPAGRAAALSMGRLDCSRSHCMSAVWNCPDTNYCFTTSWSNDCMAVQCSLLGRVKSNR